MALADFLSAVRSLILDEGIDPAIQDRKSYLRRRFPELDERQCADLADIAPERLGVYTELVFAGIRATLEWIFPLSLAVIDRLRRAETALPPAAEANLEWVRALHRFRPWTSTSQRQLAADFEAFIRDCRAPWIAAWPGLADLLDFERTDLEAFYAADVPHAPMTAADVQALSGLSVGDLMTQEFFIPEYAAIRSFRYDVPAMAQAWRSTQELPDPLPASAPATYSCGRLISTLMPKWTALSPAICEALAALPRCRPFTVDNLASRFLDGLLADDARSDEARFADFFIALQALIESGVLLRPPRA